MSDFLVVKIDGNHIWRSPPLDWQLGARWAAVAVVHPDGPLHAPKDGTLTLDVRDSREILIVQFTFGIPVVKDQRIDFTYEIIIASTGEVNANIIHRPTDGPEEPPLEGQTLFI